MSRLDSSPRPVTVDTVPEHRPEPVLRRYRPESAPIEELVEVLYRLLMDVRESNPTSGSVSAESTCFQKARE